MTILIAKQNEPILKKYFPKAKFTESTKNTSTFKVNKKEWATAYWKIKNDGYNPFALMSF